MYHGFHAGRFKDFDIPLDQLMAVQFLSLCKKTKSRKCNFCLTRCWWNRESKRLRKILDCEFVICDKTREKANEESVEVIGEVKDKDVIIVDDLIDTGGTIAMV